VFYSQRKINYGLKEELLELFELSISLSKQMGAMMKYLRQKILVMWSKMVGDFVKIKVQFCNIS